jgi:LysM repeat protein
MATIRRRRRNPGRWLAPLALIACAVTVYAVVHNTLADSSDTTTPSTRSTDASGSSKSTSAKKSAGKRRRTVYIVKSGDTLSGIADKTGVSLVTIQRLNPTLDAQTLHAGQRIRLRSSSP